MDNQKKPVLYPRSKSAEYCSVSLRTWSRLNTNEMIPRPVIIGGLHFWRKSDLDLWIAMDCPSRDDFESHRVSSQKISNIKMGIEHHKEFMAAYRAMQNILPLIVNTYPKSSRISKLAYEELNTLGTLKVELEDDAWMTFGDGGRSPIAATLKEIYSDFYYYMNP